MADVPNLDPTQNGDNKTPSEKPSYTPEPHVNHIEVNGEEIQSGTINVAHDNLEPSSISDLVKNSSIGFFEYILEFEEDHPWLFFIGIALMLFIIVGSIASFIFGAGLNFPSLFDSDQPQIEEPEEVVIEIEKPSLNAALNSLNEAAKTSSPDAYDEIVFVNKNDVIFSEELAYVKNIQNALDRNIQEELNKIDNEEDRLEHLKTYLLLLLEVEDQGSKNYSKLTNIINTLNDEKDILEDQKTSSHQKINDAFSGGGKNEITTAIQDSLEKENQYDETENKLDLAKEIHNAYAEPLQLAQARIAAIRANKEILVKNLKVISIHDAELNLIENDQISDWYVTGSSTQSQNSDTTQNTITNSNNYNSQTVNYNSEFATPKAIDSVMTPPVQFNINSIPNINGN